MQQRTLDVKIICLRCSVPCNDYNVQTTIEHALMQSIAFPDQPGHVMSYHAVSNFFTHTDPNPVFFKAIFLYNHN